MESPQRSTVPFVILVALLAVGCTAPESPAPSVARAELVRGCPLGVPGATVVAEDTEDGIALLFTSPTRTREMRERANDAAGQHGPGQGLGAGHGGRHGEGGDHGLQMMQAPPARSVAAETEDGARIRFVPVNPADKNELRAKLRDRAVAMNGATCK